MKSAVILLLSLPREKVLAETDKTKTNKMYGSNLLPFGMRESKKFSHRVNKLKFCLLSATFGLGLKIKFTVHVP